MDSYLFPRDPYRASATAPPPPLYSAYPSSYRLQPLYSVAREPDSYGLDRWNSLPLPDPYPSYAPVSRGLLPRPAFYSEALRPRNYGRPSRSFRERGDGRRQQKGSSAQQSLGPRKNAFKPQQGGKAVKQVVKAVEKVVQGGKKGNKEGGKKGNREGEKKGNREGEKKGNKEEGKKAEKSESKEVKKIDTLAKEAKELHALWRTAGQKRKMDDEKKVEEYAKVSKVPEKETKVTERNDTGKSRRRKKQRKGKKGPGEKKPSEVVAVAEPTDKGKDLPSAGKPENEKVVKVQLTEEEKNASLDLQREVYRSVIEFLGVPQGSEKTDEEALPDSEVDGGQKTKEEEVSEESQKREESAYEFFSKILEENQELKKFYVDKCNSGMFECMVCSSMDETSSKRFFNLVSLVMHASKIQKTEKRPEHRGYGRAVCTVLGWDPLRTKKLPKKASDTVADESSKKEGNSVEVKNLGDEVKENVANGDETQVLAEEVDPSKVVEGEEVNLEVAVQVKTEDASAA